MSLTVREILVQATKALENITDTPDLDARLLLEKATGYNHVQMILKSEEIISSDIVIEFNNFLKRRLNREPIAYIIEEKEFFSRTFHVTKDTLIPRPDTETLIEVSLNYINKLNYKPSVLDLCTGTGCVGITIAAETDCDITLADISDKAIEVAKYNANNLLSKKIPILKSNLLENCKTYDIIVSNPPYLTAKWCDEVSDEVKKEPRLALEGFGYDGLFIIEDIIKQASSHLSGNQSALFIECDYRQTERVKLLLLNNNFKNVTIYKDLAGKERVVGGILCMNN